MAENECVVGERQKKVSAEGEYKEMKTVMLSTQIRADKSSSENVLQCRLNICFTINICHFGFGIQC